LLTYGALCRGLLSGKMDENSTFEGDDLRKIDPKFQGERFKQYLQAVNRLSEYAREHHNKALLLFAVRWILDSGIKSAIWGARRPDQLNNVGAAMGWHLSAEDLKAVNIILQETLEEPVGPEFMAPPA